MKSPKSLLRKFFLTLGYDIRKTSHIGLDPCSDIQRLFGRRSLSVIFDVGAHTGESAIDYADQFPDATIYSFEPSPATYQI